MHLKINKIELVIISLISIFLPWSIIFATPQLQIGYWGQVEGMVSFSHFTSALAAIILAILGFKNIEIRYYFLNPLTIIPFLIGTYSIISSFFQRLPILALFGSPQIGQGAFWYISLSLLTMLYIIANQFTKLKYLLFFNIIIITLVTTIGSFYPLITGVIISFFGFNDWLAIYFTISSFTLIYLINSKIKFYSKNFFCFIIFLILGPLFWKIDNNSALALWLLLSLAWAFWLLLDFFNPKYNVLRNFLYNRFVFTGIPILLSLLIVCSSYIFWDGTSDQTDEITSKFNWLGHLGTFVARGSIVRVLFEHLNSIQTLLFGYGWGSVSELLLASFTPEVFYQINTGNRVHFHTHNELFEHLFSIGLVGMFLYISYMFYIFKYSFKYSISVAFIWLLYFCISAFWFQWISSLPFIATFTSLLILNCNYDYKNTSLAVIIKSKIFFLINFLCVAVFLFYGAYIGYYTAYKHNNSFRAAELIKIAQDAKNQDNCSSWIYDYGKGGIQFSQRFNGFSNYYKDQVMLYGLLNESDYNVLNWNLCASHELISKNNASLELINVHINTLSMVSVLPGEYGIESRKRMQFYINFWEDKLKLLLKYAPNRQDQATPLISYYVKTENDIGIKSICSHLEKKLIYQGYCDLALGSVYLKEGSFEEGILLINRANKMGILDSKDIDKKTSEELKNLLEAYKNN